MSHRGAEKEVSGRREGPASLQEAREIDFPSQALGKMARSNGFDKPESTRVSNQGSFTATGKQKPKQMGIRM